MYYLKKIGAKLCLEELKGNLSYHLDVKEAMKYFYLIPGNKLANGMIFLTDDIGCKKVAKLVRCF